MKDTKPIGLYSGLDYGNPQQNRFEVILATYTAHKLRQKIGYEKNDISKLQYWLF